MKAKILLFVLLCAVAASTGLVWAAGEAAQVPAATTSAAEAVQPDVSKTAAQLLDELTPKASEKGACCVADCFASWEECITECGANQACRQGCTADRRACTRGC